MQEKIIILDFGSQTTQLIGRRLRELNVYCEIVPYNKFPHGDESVKGVILSGSPFSVYDKSAFKVDLSGIRGKYPILGICYGCQLIAYLSGGNVSIGPREYGKQTLQVQPEPIYKNIPKASQCWMSHTCFVESLPSGFKVNATTDTCPVAGFSCEDKKLYGVQFHPESVLTPDGRKMIENWLKI